MKDKRTHSEHLGAARRACPGATTVYSYDGAGTLLRETTLGGLDFRGGAGVAFTDESRVPFPGLAQPTGHFSFDSAPTPPASQGDKPDPGPSGPNSEPGAPPQQG
jgi:YD repeat-containing protein